MAPKRPTRDELERENAHLKSLIVSHYEEMAASHAEIFELQEKVSMLKRIIALQERHLDVDESGELSGG